MNAPVRFYTSSELMAHLASEAKRKGRRRAEQRPRREQARKKAGPVAPARAPVRRDILRVATRPTGLDGLLEGLAAHIGVPTSALTTDARTGRNVNARFAICYVGRFRLGISVTQIGRALSRDHTSILHGSRAVVNRLGDRIPSSPDAVADAIAIFDALEGK